MRFNFFVIIVTLLFVQFSLAQDSQDRHLLNKEKIHTLQIIKKNLDWTRKEIEKKESLLKSNKTNDPKIYKTIEDLRRKHDEMLDNFLLAASNVNYELAPRTTQVIEKRDLLKELEEMAGPLMDSFRRISARPRRIESMRNQIHVLNDQYSLGETALQNLNRIEPDLDNELLEEIEKSKKLIQEKQEEIQVGIDTIRGKLTQELKDKQTFLESATDLGKRFLRTKGKNLFFSFLAFILVLGSAIFIRQKIIVPKMLSNTSNSFSKVLDAVYGLIAFLSAMSCAIAVLYLFNDWLLVTVSILFLTAILWSFKNFAPQFMKELRLILNLGPVKEGERVIWEGIPWLVKKLGVYSILVNPKLQGGTVKLNSNEMVKLISRAWGSKEAWFPSSVGEWVQLSDGSYGQVFSQSPEQVVLYLYQGTLKYYSTCEFLKLYPQNFSFGFSLIHQFGLSYSLQKEIAQVVPRIVLEHIETILKNKYPLTFLNLGVEFQSCEESALILWIRSKWLGEEAHRRFELEREINQLLIELCNKHHWSIPFKQIEIHMNK